MVLASAGLTALVQLCSRRCAPRLTRSTLHGRGVGVGTRGVPIIKRFTAAGDEQGAYDGLRQAVHSAMPIIQNP